MLKDFKEFIQRGNVIDLAVGVIIGAAFGKVTGSFVSDVLMPPLGQLMGRVDFKELFVSLSGQSYPTLDAAKKAGAATINYGLFLNTVIDFLLVAFAVFLLVKAVNRLKREPPPADPTTKECPFCVSSIPIKASRCPNCTSALTAAAAH